MKIRFMATTGVLIGRSENVLVVYGHMLHSTLFILMTLITTAKFLLTSFLFATNGFIVLNMYSS